MWVNGEPIERYGAKLKMEYTSSGYELENSAFKGRGRSSFVLLNSSIGFKTLTLPLIFEGCGPHDVEYKKSLFDMLVYGKNELIMDDGYMYSAYLSQIGDAVHPHPNMLEITYTFVGVKHGPLVTVQANTIYCDSTLPHTDCILTATVGQTGNNYQIGTVTFAQVTQGEVLTVDGINKRILVNEVPAAERAEWITFPSLSPGKNIITCDDPLTVEFYPVYF